MLLPFEIYGIRIRVLMTKLATTITKGIFINTSQGYKTRRILA